MYVGTRRERSTEERRGESTDGRREASIEDRWGESTDGRRGVGDGLDDRGRWDADDEPIPLEGVTTRTLLVLGERAPVGVDGLDARAVVGVLAFVGTRTMGGAPRGLDGVGDSRDA